MRYYIFLYVLLAQSLSYGQFNFEDRFVISSNVEHHNTIVDVDNDGNSDLVQVTFAFDQVFCRDLVYQLLWKKNVGDGVFKEPTLIYEFESTQYDESRYNETLVDDYDNDGDLDIVLVVEYHEDLTIDLDYHVLEYFENNGDGTFQAPVEIFNYEYGFSLRPFYDILQFDVDNDGDKDFFISIHDRIYQVINLGNGNFTEISFLSSSHEASNMYAVDMDNDGFLDIVEKSFDEVVSNHRIYLWKNLGGSFDTFATGFLIIDSFSPRHISVMDVDGDNFEDLIVAEFDTDLKPFTYLNNGSGDFTNLFGPRQTLNFGGGDVKFHISGLHFNLDLDNDGDMDIIYNNDGAGSSRLINEGNLNFTQASLINGLNTVFNGHAIDGFADVNDNGFDDILIDSFGFDLWLDVSSTGDIVLGNGMVVDQFPISSASLGDVNNDGNKDIVLSPNGIPVYFEINDATEFIGPQLISSESYVTLGPVVADFNNDGVNDMAGYETITFLYADGTEESFPLPINLSYDAQAIDYEGDGDLDILDAFDHDILLNDGTGNFVLDNIPFGEFPSRDQKIMDINDDGIVDFVNGTGQFELLLSSGFLQYQIVSLHPDLNQFNNYDFIDVNLDGRKDVVFNVYNIGSGLMEVRIKYNLGNNQFSESEIVLETPTFFDAAMYLFDLDYNGKFDVVFSSEANDVNKVSYFLQNLDGTFEAEETVYELLIDCGNAGNAILAFEDVDGDEIKELINLGSQQVSILANGFDIDPFNLDFDGDGVTNIEEDLNGNGDPSDDDTDGDGIPNYFDTDDDNDTVATSDEIVGIGAGNRPVTIFIDTDDDGIENYLDDDDDGDNTLTIDEDYNGNGDPIDDDTNSNGIPDFLDPEVTTFSINDQLLSNMQLFPNPAINMLTVKSSYILDEIEIQLYTIQGRLLKSYSKLPNNNEIILDVSELQSGVYILNISNSENSVTKKLIKR